VDEVLELDELVFIIPLEEELEEEEELLEELDEELDDEVELLDELELLLELAVNQDCINFAVSVEQGLGHLRGSPLARGGIEMAIYSAVILSRFSSVIG
jgi:hypothetical protein